MLWPMLACFNFFAGLALLTVGIIMSYRGNEDHLLNIAGGTFAIICGGGWFVLGYLAHSVIVVVPQR